MADEVTSYPFPRDIRFSPPEQWNEVRERGPVVTVTLPSGDEADLVTRYHEARELLGDARFTRGLPADVSARISATDDGGIFARQAASGLEIFEGAGHMRWRRLMSKSFTIRRVETMRPGIRQVAENLVAAMAKAGPPADLIAGLGDQLPVSVVGDLLGVPEADRGKFGDWADKLLSLTRYTKADADTATGEVVGYFGELIKAKRANPRDDLLSDLVRVSDDNDGRLSETELVITAAALFLPGHENVAYMIGKMMATLLVERERFQQVVDDPAVIPEAVEEVLRYDTNPSLGLPRFITEKVCLGEQQVREGTTMIVNLALVNHDPRRFPNPSHVDLRRQNNQHLAFGAGPHFCIGAPLARATMQETLRALVLGLPGLRLAVPRSELKIRTGFIMVGLEELPVEW
jgi:cytochrome P450